MRIGMNTKEDANNTLYFATNVIEWMHKIGSIYNKLQRKESEVLYINLVKTTIVIAFTITIIWNMMRFYGSYVTQKDVTNILTKRTLQNIGQNDQGKPVPIAHVWSHNMHAVAIYNTQNMQLCIK